MRKIRGSKEKGVLQNIILLTKEKWLMYMLIGLWASAGVLFGVILGRVTDTVLIGITLIFLSIFLAGLMIAWFLNKNLQLLIDNNQQMGLKEQYNGFTLIIGELERNLNYNWGNGIEDGAWQHLKYQLAYFPPHLYQELTETYERLLLLSDLDGVEYRRVLHEEVHLPTLISKLKDWQKKIRKELPFV